MPAASTLTAFAAVAFLMALSPGPNLLYLASRSLCQGRLAGFASLAGVCTGMLVYMLAAAAGLSALFLAVPGAYDAVRWVGALYLLWLAYRTFTHPAATSTVAAPAVERPAALYRRGLGTCLLNPKIVVTYGSLLPQFIDPSIGSILTQTLTLGVVQIVAAAGAHALVIAAAAAVAGALPRMPIVARAQRYLLGAILTALALRLLVDRRGPV